MMETYIEADATFSDCGRYRYLLRRVWDHAKPRALFVMLNPSTASARADDATIRSCVRLMKAQSYGSIEVVNLFGLVTPEPRELLKTPDPVGPGNEGTVKDGTLYREDAGIIGRCTCGWGTGYRFSSFVASAAFMDHQEAMETKPRRRAASILGERG